MPHGSAEGTHDAAIGYEMRDIAQDTTTLSHLQRHLPQRDFVETVPANGQAIPGPGRSDAASRSIDMPNPTQFVALILLFVGGLLLSMSSPPENER